MARLSQTATPAEEPTLTLGADFLGPYEVLAPMSAGKPY
jgi:hypothetical protein